MEITHLKDDISEGTFQYPIPYLSRRACDVGQQIDLLRSK
jgi:hypothetical protein